jgi:hypothetical protein
VKKAAALALSVLALTVPAVAQEACDVKATFRTEGAGARFVQILSCGDGDLTNAYACTKPANMISVVLPVAPFEAAVGRSFNVTFTIGTKRYARKMTVTAPLTDGADDMGGAAQLSPTDPLWLALAEPGTDIFTDNGNHTGNAGTVAESAAKLSAFKAACGL